MERRPRQPHETALEISSKFHDIGFNIFQKHPGGFTLLKYTWKSEKSLLNAVAEDFFTTGVYEIWIVHYMIPNGLLYFHGRLANKKICLQLRKLDATKCRYEYG